MKPLDIVLLGLSITSSWGNGHATTYRSLMRELTGRGHRVTFLERDVAWYADNRDLPKPPYGKTHLYRNLNELDARFGTAIARADLVILGSYVPEGVAVGRLICDSARGLTAFYDIDTPITLAKLAAGDYEYLHPDLIPLFDLYLSFTGGPVLKRLEREFGAQQARALYCSVDPKLYHPQKGPLEWDLGYIGTYSSDRQAKLEALLVEPAQAWAEGRFIVAGPQYPADIEWPENVARIDHLPPDRHRRFYSAQRFTLNVTRAAMVRAGWSPSVRLFEAAACATPILTDWWDGIDTLFQPDREILIAESTEGVLRVLRDMPEPRRRAFGSAARKRVLTTHTAAHRAAELERMVLERLGREIRPSSSLKAAASLARA